MLRLLKTISAVVAFLFAGNLFAVLQPAKVFSDNMVLQQRMSVPVWGSADIGANIVVEFAGQRAETRADNAGRWKWEFKPLSVSTEGRPLSIRSGNERLLFKNVLVGGVWFSGGQSNMGYSAGSMAKRLTKGKALVDAADYPGIRFRKVNEKNMPMPQEDLKGGSWFVCTPNSVKGFSAVGFIFARKLHEKLKVPIGIIDCSWGGTPIEPYIPAEAFTGHPTLERLAKLSGGVAIIKVGAATEVELKEKKARVEDALHSTRAAVEEGVVPGGGVALIRALQGIQDLEGENPDQTVGIKVALKAMEAPMRQIATNSGDEASVVVDKVKAGSGNYGYNASTGGYGDMIEMGILDPAKVTRTALQAAASIAGMMLTTECMIADAPSTDGGGMPDMGGMGGMM